MKEIFKIRYTPKKSDTSLKIVDNRTWGHILSTKVTWVQPTANALDLIIFALNNYRYLWVTLTLTNQS